MSSHITIKDIAKAMGCAPSTVSRALNNSSNISPAVREAIQRYAMEHNYRPNEFALSLRNNRSNTIGVILPQIKHYFFASVLSGIERAAAEAGYNIMVAQSNEEYEKEVSIVESFRKAKVCGVIASLAKGTMDYTHFRRLVEEEVPLVFYDRICTELNTSRVVVDDYTGAFAAVESDPMVAATAAMAVMSLAGERAAVNARGNGSMQMHFLDELYNLTPETL